MKRHEAGKVATPPLSLAVKMWPTPSTKDVSGGAVEAIKTETGWKRVSKQGVCHGAQLHDVAKTIGGQLNPDWVEWLMGWPIGWTSIQPLTELVWLDWSVDPADSSSTEQWATPNASARSGRNPNTGSGEGLYYQVREKGHTENPIIPRIATGIKDRVNRLKALGNGQVSLCAATAWEILK